MILNAGVAYILMVIMCPLLYFARPLKFRTVVDAFRSLLTISLMIGTYWIISLTKIDLVQELKEVIVT